jgi:hypothetical protein
VQSAFELPGELPEVVNEFPVQVLYAPFNFAFVLRMGRMGKMGFDGVLPAPPLPFLLELIAVIRQCRLWNTLLTLQQRGNFLCSRFVVKLFRHDQEPAVVVDAYEEPVLPALNREGTFEVDLPQLSDALALKNFQRLCSLE